MSRGVRILLILAVALVAVPAAGRGRPADKRPAIALARPLPNVVRQGETAIVGGRVRNLTRTCRSECSVALEGRRPSAAGRPQRWSSLVRTGRVAAAGRFTLRWQVPRHLETGPLELRVVARRSRRLLAETSAAESFVGPAAVPCAAPAPPGNVPAGDGWIVGGVYEEGGPFPGIDRCQSQPYSITATDSSGAVAASQQVPGGHSYTLVVPAGRYMLKASPCGFGSASVKAGRQTEADAICAFP